jgi:hypothetical protein
MNVEQFFNALEKAVGCLSDPHQHQIQIRLPDGKTFLSIDGVYVDRMGIVKIQAVQPKDDHRA